MNEFILTSVNVPIVPLTGTTIDAQNDHSFSCVFCVLKI